MHTRRSERIYVCGNAMNPVPESTAPSQQAKGGRLVGLDVLRAIAALGVVLSHLVFFPNAHKVLAGSASWVIQVIQTNIGAWGVGLFFVLSGLCIHLPLARRRVSDPEVILTFRPYARRRFTRIYPPHLVALVLSAVVALLLPAIALKDTALAKPTALQFVLHVFMLHSFVPSAVSSINAVLWTIAVETHFYVLYPLLLLATRRYGMVRITASLFVMSLIARVVGLVTPYPIGLIMEGNFICRFWEWSLGCCCAERIVSRGVPKNRGWALFSVLCGASLLFALWVKTGTRMLLGDLAGHLVGNELTAVIGPMVYGVVVYVACGLGSPDRTRGGRIVHQIGVESYSLYLSHPITLTLWMFGLHSLGAPWWVAAVTGAPISVVGSHLFFRIVERRFMKRASDLGSVYATPPVCVITAAGV